MFNKLIGVALIIAAFFVEAMWLGATFGTVVVGIVLLIFAPGILLLPFNILFAMGIGFLAYENENHSSYNSYSNDSYEKEENVPVYAKSQMQKYYDILGCSIDDDLNIVQKAYRNLSKKFHPDTIESKGLDREFVEYATNKMQEINEAYRKIKESKVQYAA